MDEPDEHAPAARGVVRLPAGSTRVTDADEEVCRDVSAFRSYGTRCYSSVGTYLICVENCAIIPFSWILADGFTTGTRGWFLTPNRDVLPEALRFDLLGLGELLHGKHKCVVAPRVFYISPRFQPR